MAFRSFLRFLGREHGQLGNHPGNTCDLLPEWLLGCGSGVNSGVDFEGCGICSYYRERRRVVLKSGTVQHSSRVDCRINPDPNQQQEATPELCRLLRVDRGDKHSPARAQEHCLIRNLPCSPYPRIATTLRKLQTTTHDHAWGELQPVSPSQRRCAELPDSDLAVPA